MCRKVSLCSIWAAIFVPINLPSIRKGKPTALEGFKKGWDKPFRDSQTAKSHSTLGAPVVIPTKIQDGFGDEQPAAVTAARASKATALPQKGGTAKVLVGHLSDGS
jgi:hypothetical protein